MSFKTFRTVQKLDLVPYTLCIQRVRTNWKASMLSLTPLTLSSGTCWHIVSHQSIKRQFKLSKRLNKDTAKAEKEIDLFHCSATPTLCLLLSSLFFFFLAFYPQLHHCRISNISVHNTTQCMFFIILSKLFWQNANYLWWVPRNNEKKV